MFNFVSIKYQTWCCPNMIADSASLEAVMQIVCGQVTIHGQARVGQEVHF